MNKFGRGDEMTPSNVGPPPSRRRFEDFLEALRGFRKTRLYSTIRFLGTKLKLRDATSEEPAISHGLALIAAAEEAARERNLDLGWRFVHEFQRQ